MHQSMWKSFGDALEMCWKSAEFNMQGCTLTGLSSRLNRWRCRGQQGPVTKNVCEQVQGGPDTVEIVGHRHVVNRCKRPEHKESANAWNGQRHGGHRFRVC